ncbi:hypothetical protein BIU82_13900 [Arthrobacter sp. SW1]|nr:hypothetical protein BIU82_13900 [Arthrobacter sp. SW1]
MAVASASTACTAPAVADPEPEPSISLPAVDRKAFSSVRASLNEETGEVVLPMDKYWYSERENVIVNNAVAFLLEDCVEAAGFTMMPWGGDHEAKQDSSFGQWSRQLAARNGTRPHFRVVPGVHDKANVTVSEADKQAYKKCSSQVGRAGFPELLPGLAGDTSIQNKIMLVVLGLTERDAEFVQYRQSWEACIKANGLTLPEDESWVPMTNGQEDDIRAALIVIDCKEKAGGVQKPYDILAQYQAAQIKNHQAELNALAEQKAAAVERAKQVLRDHGVADAKL